MSFALLASAKINGATGGTTAGINTTGAKLIVIHAGYAATITISDSKGNTWTPATAAGLSPNAQFFYCNNPTVGTGHTFTIAGAGTVSSIVVSAWSVTGTASLDSQGSAGNPPGVANSQFSTVSFTPTTNNCLLIGGCAFSSGGFVSGFTPGSGWTSIDAQDYVSGTSYGSSQVYKIQTTATAVPTSEHPASWGTITGATYTGIAFSEGTSNTLTITTPVPFKVFQRSGSTGSITVTGTYTGTPTAIEASFNGGAYSTIVASPSGGTFSGTLSAQAQGQGTLTVRFTNDVTATASVATIGIGDVFVVAGDSISEGRGTNPQSYTHATLKAAKFTQANAWGDGVDGIDTGTSAGSHWPLLATQIMASQGVPVAFISCGTGGTDVAGSNNSWAKPNADYSGLTTQVTNSGVNAVKGCLFHLGPNAVVNASTLSLATYRTALDTLTANLAADVAGAPKLNIGLFGDMTTGTPPDRRSAIDNIRGAIVQGWGANANIKPGPVLIEQLYSDGVHPISDAELAVVAKRWWVALQETYYGGSGGRGPRLSSAQWNAGRNILTVTFDRSLKTGLVFSTAPWIVKDNTTTMTISGIAYHGTNPAALVFTMSAAATGASNTTTLTFASSNDAVSQVVPLSTDIAMASGAAVQIPAEPIYAAAVSEANLASISITLTTNGTTPAASLTGLKWAWFDQITPDLFVAPTDKGSVGSTNSSGVLALTLPNSTKTSGQIGWLVVTNSDGTTTQSPAHKAFSGPVAVV